MASSKSSPRRRARATPTSSSAPKRHKTALVLAGGGVTGVVYEMGVLQALSQFLGDDFSIFDFDMIVGLSAGSIVGSFLANGVPPAEMISALHERPEATITPFPKWDVFRPNFGEFIQRAATLPVTLLSNAAKKIRRMTFGGNPYISLFDEILPSAIFTNHKVEQYLRENLHQAGRTNDFRQLRKALYVVATELDTGERTVFGDTHHDHVPISKAVQASSAIPLFYKPVRIGRREYVDGAIRKTLHIDIAIKKGAELIVCVNPVVPIHNDVEREAVPLFEGKGRYLSEKGFGYVWWQMIRLLLHSRIPLGFERYKRMYPNVDIVLIEPRMDDYKMFFHNIMDYEARIPIATHGYETAHQQLTEKFSELQSVFERHGVPLVKPERHLPMEAKPHAARAHTPRTRVKADIGLLEKTLQELEQRLAI